MLQTTGERNLMLTTVRHAPWYVTDFPLLTLGNLSHGQDAVPDKSTDVDPLGRGWRMRPAAPDVY